MVFSLVVPFAGVKAAEADSVSHLIDKAANILHSEFAQNGARNEDNGVGAYALYVLIQAGVDVSTWIYNGVPLKESVIELVYQDIAGSSAVPAKRLAQDLLAMKALGREDLVQQLLQILKSREGLHGFDSDIFSDFWVYDLLGRAGLISVVNQVYAREYILSEQNTVAGNTYGAWGFAWDGDFYPDFMATAQAVRVLAYLDSDTPDQEIQAAIERGMQWLKKQQQADGSFAAYIWEDPLINTVEMIATLKVLGEDPASVKSVEGKSPVDYLLTKALNPDGTFGAVGNVMDATWALYGYYLLGAQGEQEPPSTPQGSSQGEQEQPSTPTGSSGSSTNTCTVRIAVVGKDGELLYGPASVTVLASNRWGLTVLGALDATGLPYTMSSRWPDFVESIAGQANIGMSGWMYQVNGSVPSLGASQYPVKEGDKIIWWYSKDLNTPAPKWEDLEQRLSSPGDTGASQRVENILAELQKGLSSPAQAITRLTEIIAGLKEAEITDQLKKRMAEVVDTLKEALARLPEKALKVQVEDGKIKIKIDGDTVKEQVSAIKNAAKLAGELQSVGIVEEVAKLYHDTVVVALPDQAGPKEALFVTLPASAARAIAEGNLKLGLETRNYSLYFPPEAIATIVEGAAKDAEIEFSAQKVEPARISLPQGAVAVGGTVLDFQINAITSEGKKEKLKANFARKIVVTFSLQEVDTSRIDVDKLAVYRQREDGSWEYVGGTISSDGKSFTFETEHLSVYALLEYNKTFKDIQGHWAQKDVELMARRLIARGLSDDIFAPDQEVTRAQATAFLARSLGLEESNLKGTSFRDVPPQHWASQTIEAAYRAGLVVGTGEGNFEPERTITREEMAALLVRALKKEGWEPAQGGAEDKNNLAVYADSSEISPWARDSVKVCVSAGILRGRSAAELVPQGKITRAEAMVMLKRMLQVLGRIPDSP